ncbi:MAG: hypothetical protein ACEPOV_13995 [Hyphomicrobiales bacterium]
MKSFKLLLSLLFITGIVISSCKKDKDDNETPENPIIPVYLVKEVKSDGESMMKVTYDDMKRITEIAAKELNLQDFLANINEEEFSTIKFHYDGDSRILTRMLIYQDNALKDSISITYKDDDQAIEMLIFSYADNEYTKYSKTAYTLNDSKKVTGSITSLYEYKDETEELIPVMSQENEYKDNNLIRHKIYDIDEENGNSTIEYRFTYGEIKNPLFRFDLASYFLMESIFASTHAPITETVNDDGNQMEGTYTYVLDEYEYIISGTLKVDGKDDETFEYSYFK